MEPRLCTGYRARLRCGRSCVRAPVGSKPNVIKLVFAASVLRTRYKRSKRKQWLSRNEINVSEWDDMSAHNLSLSKLALLKSNKACCYCTKPASSSSSQSKCNTFSPCYSKVIHSKYTYVIILLCIVCLYRQWRRGEWQIR